MVTSIKENLYSIESLVLIKYDVVYSMADSFHIYPGFFLLSNRYQASVKSVLITYNFTGIHFFTLFYLDISTRLYRIYVQQNVYDPQINY